MRSIDRYIHCTCCLCQVPHEPYTGTYMYMLCMLYMFYMYMLCVLYML